MNTMEVALFPSADKAEPIRQRLIAAGIPAREGKGFWATWMWFVPGRSASVRLEVPAEQFERAEDLLLNWDAAEGALRDAIRCPECRSLRVDYPQFTRKFFLLNLAIGVAAELGLVERDYYCEDCHYTWPKAGARPRRARPHMAPYYFLEGVEQTTRDDKRKAA